MTWGRIGDQTVRFDCVTGVDYWYEQLYNTHTTTNTYIHIHLQLAHSKLHNNTQVCQSRHCDCMSNVVNCWLFGNYYNVYNQA